MLLRLLAPTVCGVRDITISIRSNYCVPRFVLNWPILLMFRRNNLRDPWRVTHESCYGFA